MMRSPPLTILIVTKDETPENLIGCFEAIADFAPVIVIDTTGTKSTQIQETTKKFGARYIPYEWDGAYPKKRQWSLEMLNSLGITDHWILFIDADERLTQKLKTEISKLFQIERDSPEKDGYFVSSLYKIGPHVCHFGMMNRKLVLFDRTKISFPVIDDLSCPGMDEIEGHYQPSAREAFTNISLGHLRHPMIHLALQDKEKWVERHERYAKWAICMTRRRAWPKDPVIWREILKRLIRHPKLRCIMPELAFLHSYIFRLGIIDGRYGLHLALSRRHYYKKIAQLYKSV